MFIQIIANLGIIIMNIYLLFKLSNGFLEKENFSNWQVMGLIVLQALTGILLIHTSAVIAQTRIDFRFLLYSISMKYLGKKVTLPAMFLIAIARLSFDQSLSAWVNAISILFLMVTLPLIFNWVKNKLDDFAQWLMLITYCLLIAVLTYIYLLPDVRQTAQVSVMLAGTSYSLAFIAYKIILDMQNILKMVHIDNLTQLHNTRKLQEDILRLERIKQNCAVISFDVDHFKKVNDTYGHAVGDTVLKEVSKSLAHFYGKTKRFYRTGGEEFVVLVSGEEQGEIVQLAEKIHQRIQQLKIQLEDETMLGVTVSLGVACQNKEEPLLETIRRADMALYEAKNNGRNQIAVH